MELHEAIDSVSDTASFLAFVRLLVTDRVHFKVQKEAASPSSPYSSSTNVWENSTIEAFLEAAISWAEDTDFGISQGLAAENLWRRFAVFLYCGKIYE